ncbi:MAG: hypothetical protein LBB06_01680 [Endomicrobium sp.]|nr:hypothetical protein [Endomicrobium sp.]
MKKATKVLIFNEFYTIHADVAENVTQNKKWGNIMIKKKGKAKAQKSKATKGKKECKTKSKGGRTRAS